jgi:uncharacterized protein YgbK (DUF1537 family)
MLSRRLRILADDLTGALDTAAQFAGSLGPVAVRFRDGDADGEEPCLAYASATRERGAEAAEAKLARLGGFFTGAGIAFKKVDSLLRGHSALEVATAYRTGGFASAIVAPAFPAQGRVTRGGVQRMRQFDGSWMDVAPKFLGQLEDHGLEVRRAGSPATIRGAGVFLCDAETDVDLTAIVARAPRLETPLLWAGAAGLAAALAGRRTPRCTLPPKPLLAIVGSIHPVSRAQVLAVAGRWPEAVVAVREAEDAAAAVNAALDQHALAVVRFSIPAGSTVALAGRAITEGLGRLLPRLHRPAGLFVTGGETLEAVAKTLGAESFSVAGEVAPGVPRSLMHGGRWDGVFVASKSGAFGDADLLMRVIERAGATL